MTTNSNRLIMQYEQLAKQVNREVINPEIQVLTIDELKPVAELVARSRAAYLKQLFTLAKHHSNDATLPTDDEMAELQKLRRGYIDLADASKSLEIAIQRDYLDLKTE